MIFCYQAKNFRAKSLALIKICNQIIEEFRADGYELTLRQLYYQLVGRALIPNNEKSYDNVGALLSDARLAGLVDWDAIVDRSRAVRSLSHWDNPSEIIAGAAGQFHYDLWEGQATRVEVWVEKDALSDVVGQPATELDTPFFACKGYTSQSEMWGASQRIIGYYENNDAEDVVILHFGDHDPSGIDMTRDIEERLALFCEAHGHNAPTINRLALNMNQVRQYKLPPNPAKLTDCRVQKYIATYGRESWELDAINPRVISNLVRTNILKYLDMDTFEEMQAKQAAARSELSLISDNYDRTVKLLRKPAKKRKK
jgi:hypothetical protein